MDVLVAGGHGQIGRRLLRLLDQRGHTARGLIRNPDHAADLEADGAHAILCDLETDDLRPHLEGVDAIVFSAGAGPGSGEARKRTVDLGGALKCIAAAQELGVARFVMVSAMGTGDPEHSGAMRPYLEAKAEADAALETSGLDWTIVRPGRLTNDPGTGHVDAKHVAGHNGEIPRDDVALVLYHCLEARNTVHTHFELISGPVDAELAVYSIHPET
jgi:uncharacterized protein YbjT (DUF2867 family)